MVLKNTYGFSIHKANYSCHKFSCMITFKKSWPFLKIKRMTASLFKNIAVLTNIGVLTHVILYPKITGYKLTLTSTSLLLLLLLSHFSRVRLCCNPMDCSLQGSSVHGIFQARALEWVAIAFSEHISSLWKLEASDPLDGLPRWLSG